MGKRLGVHDLGFLPWILISMWSRRLSRRPSTRMSAITAAAMAATGEMIAIAFCNPGDMRMLGGGLHCLLAIGIALSVHGFLPTAIWTVFEVPGWTFTGLASGSCGTICADRESLSATAAPTGAGRLSGASDWRDTSGSGDSTDTFTPLFPIVRTSSSLPNISSAGKACEPLALVHPARRNASLICLSNWIDSSSANTPENAYSVFSNRFKLVTNPGKSFSDLSVPSRFTPRAALVANCCASAADWRASASNAFASDASRLASSICFSYPLANAATSSALASASLRWDSASAACVNAEAICFSNESASSRALRANSIAFEDLTSAWLDSATVLLDMSLANPAVSAASLASPRALAAISPNPFISVCCAVDRMPLNSWSQPSARETRASYTNSPPAPRSINIHPTLDSLRTHLSNRCVGSSIRRGTFCLIRGHDKKYSPSSINTPITTANVQISRRRKYTSLRDWKLVRTATSNNLMSSDDGDMVDTHQTDVVIAAL